MVAGRGAGRADGRRVIGVLVPLLAAVVLLSAGVASAIPEEHGKALPEQPQQEVKQNKKDPREVSSCNYTWFTLPRSPPSSTTTTSLQISWPESQSIYSEANNRIIGMQVVNNHCVFLNCYRVTVCRWLTRKCLTD